MVRRMLRLVAGLAAVTFAGACAQTPGSPMSPSAIESEMSANPDGSTLKVSAPVLVSPEDGARVETRRPAVVFNNSAGRFTGVTLNYQLQVFDAAGAVVGEFVVPQGAGGQSTFEATAELAFDTEFRWRVRAALDGQVGPWSPLWSFKTPQRVLIGDGTGPVGQSRDIGINEAVDILQAIYSAGNYNIFGGSTRDQMNLFLEIGVAAIHYGHPKWNPRGADSNWCIKNGGPGRPQSDDVIVRCNSRDAWDLIGSIGARGAFWNPTYIGRLPGEQAVYAPRQSTLGLLPR
jgi:hypothetical protein